MRSEVSPRYAAFLWFFVGDNRISEAARKAIESQSDENWVSIASLWEIAIKASLGKLILNAQFDDVIAQALKQQSATVLPAQLSHFSVLHSLPFHSGDPFDRLLVAQALVENASIVSRDAAFDSYGVTRVW